MKDLQSTIAIVVAVAFIVMLIAGAANKIVVYFDTKDFLISFMPWGSIILAYILINIYHHGEGEVNFEHLSGMQTFVWYVGIACSVIFFIWSMKLSITYNRAVSLGFFVGIFKTLSSLLGVLIVVGNIGKVLDNKSSKKDMFIAMLVIGIFVWFGKKLINGKQVYLEKGWPLQSGV